MNKFYLYKIVRPILYIWLKIRYNPTIIGKENIPKEGKIILAGNHTNNLDGILLGMTTKRVVNFVAKIELFKGIKGYFFKGMGLIPVDRSIRDKSVIPSCINRLNNDNIVAIFPEGTINRTDDIIMPFKVGAVVISNRSNTEIVPFAINGIYKRGKLKIVIGKSYMPTDDVEKETKKLEKKVIKLLK